MSHCSFLSFLPLSDCRNLPITAHHCPVVEVKGDLAVVGSFTPAQIGSVNAAGKKNVDGNRLMAKLLGAESRFCIFQHF